MNTETYITYEQAKKLKTLGFNWECDTYYNGHGNLCRYATTDMVNRNTNGHHTPSCSAPTQAVAAKWLREIKKIAVEARLENFPDAYLSDYEPCYFPTVIVMSGCDKMGRMWNENLYTKEPKWFDFHESAMSAGLDVALELLTYKNDKL